MIDGPQIYPMIQMLFSLLQQNFTQKKISYTFIEEIQDQKFPVTHPMPPPMGQPM